jgi:hypothetical protein
MNNKVKQALKDEFLCSSFKAYHQFFRRVVHCLLLARTQHVPRVPV